MKSAMKFLLTVLLTLYFHAFLFSQKDFSKFSFDSLKVYRLEMMDGTKITGTIIMADSLNIVIKTESIPRIEIPFVRIKSVETVDSEHFIGGRYWFPNPNPTRYLIGPSAINLKEGEGYYQNVWVLLNSVNIGITDNISIGGGIEFISTIASITTSEISPIFFLTPKVGFEVSKNLNAGLGLLYVSVPSFDDSDGNSHLGIAYGVGTYGSIENNVSGGLGWGFVEDEFSAKPIVMVSGMARVWRNASVVSENWFIPTGEKYYGFLSYGVRFFGEKISVDLAFINNADIIRVFFLGAPFVDFVVKF